ncbi:prostaglandin G/H synthase 2-like, partial [Mus pahari]|uniref:prostaglandin G/H synthase 2-like n=1 Tax=Mus pahari TaxID=10093 RepID=UPI000A30ACB2
MLFRAVLLCAALVLSQAANPCCSNPCQNRGECMSIEFDQYKCDCTRTGFFGESYTTPEFLTRIKLLLKPTPNTVHYILTHFKGVWNIVNNLPFLRSSIMRYVLTSRSHLIGSPPTYPVHYGYKIWEASSNLSYYTRALPPVADDCPAPMGVKGNKELPDSKEVLEKVLLRREFIPDPQGSNMMLAFFAQHFTHQFFKTDQKRGPGFTRGLGHGVDLNHIYGETLERQHKRCIFKDGKLKYKVFGGEVKPLTVRDTQVETIYPPHIPENLPFALWSEIFVLVPGLMMYATVWLWEHNRVCDILKQEHLMWDERLFLTSRLILIGVNIKIVIEDYVQHLSSCHFKLKFDPELLFNQQLHYQNHIASPFNTLYHWQALLSYTFNTEVQECSFNQFLYNSILLEHGLTQIVESFTRQIAGQVAGGRNVPMAPQAVSKTSIDQSREMNYQSLDKKPYASFEELRGEKQIGTGLKALFSGIDTMELYPGLLEEKPCPVAILRDNLVELGAPFFLKGLRGDPICYPQHWKPSTFSGVVGFKIINTALIQSLICKNVKGCPFFL